MIFDFLLIIIFQPLISSIFFFLAPILNDFLKEKNQKLIFNLIIFSLLADILFLKPFGFFLMIISFSLLMLFVLERILSYHYFYQKLIYFIIFNTSFLLLFFYLSFKTLFDLIFFSKFLILNIIFQIIYFIVKSLFNQ